MSVPTNMDIVVCEHTPNHDYVLCGCGCGCGLLCMCVCVCVCCVRGCCVCVCVGVRVRGCGCVGCCVDVWVWVWVWVGMCGVGGWVGARMASYDWSIFFRVPQTFVLRQLKTLTFSWPWERIQRCVITCMSM